MAIILRYFAEFGRFHGQFRTICLSKEGVLQYQSEMSALIYEFKSSAKIIEIY